MLLILTVIALSACAEEEEPPKEDLPPPDIRTPEELFPNSQPVFSELTENRLYDIESAVVTYQLSGTENGEEVLTFDQYGIREMRVKQVRESEESDALTPSLRTIMIPGTVFEEDLVKGTKTRSRKPRMNEEEGIFTHLGQANLAMLISQGGRPVGSETVLGIPCEMWIVEKTRTKYWFWNHLALKTERRFGDRILVIEALKVDTAANVSPSTFDIPESVVAPKPKELRKLMDKLK